MKHTPQAIIGSKTTVDFPAYGILKIPAKVDTGADSSSIWASDIREEDGKLHFRLFDRQSPFFDGKEIVVKNFKTQLIKNSFGQTEFRYKVPMSIRLEGKRIRTRFTLADRSRNSYPILIGRHTLKNKFLVDVAHESDVNKSLPVLVLVNVGNENIHQRFKQLEELNNGQIDADVVRYEDLVMTADSGETSIVIKKTGRDIASYGFIFFLTRVVNAELAAIVAAYAKRHGVGFSDQAAALLSTDTKAHQAMLLSSSGVNMPRSVYMDRINWSGSYDELVEVLGEPFIFKDNHGLKGRNNFLISSSAEFVSACQAVQKENLQMVAQSYIPNDGCYRLVVMGRDVVFAMFRPVDTSKSHLYDKKRDGEAREVSLQDLSSEVLQMAVSAAQTLSLEVAGVDILQDKHTGEWYCIEVNNSPQLVGGAFVEQKMKALGEFFIQESKK